MIAAVSTGKQGTIISKLRERNFKLLLQLFRTIKARFIWVIFSNFRLKKLTRPRIIIFIETISHYTDSHGNIKHAFSDDVLSKEDQKYDIIFIERTKGSKKVKGALVKRQIQENFLVFPGSLELPFKMKKQKEEIKSKINRLAVILDKKMNDDENTKTILMKALNSLLVRRTLINFLIEKKKAKKFFSRVRPSSICLTNSQVYQGTIAAAKELNIKVIEFQHGVIDKNHPVYNYPSFLKDKKHELLVPDEILMWGEYWKENLLKQGFWKDDELFAYGHSRISDFKSSNSVRLIESSENKIATILYTSTLPLLNESISFLEKTIETAISRNLPLKIIVKLHPGELDYADKYFPLQAKYPSFCEIKTHDSADLYELFKISRLHISVYSATLFESFELGVPTGIINLSAKDYFISLCNKKYFMFFESPESLAAFSEDIVDQTDKWLYWLKNTKENGNYFYAANTPQNYIDHLNNLVSLR